MNTEELSTLLKTVRSGDMTAFEKIYKELKTPVYTIIVRITGDENMAEDLLQEVFIKLFRFPPTQGIHNPRAYIFKIARNLAIDDMRKQKPLVPLDEIEDTVQDSEWDFDTKSDIEAAMKQLTPLERQIVTLRINGGLKFREIADIVEKPSGTVLWRYQTAVSKLRSCLSGGRI